MLFRSLMMQPLSFVAWAVGILICNNPILHIPNLSNISSALSYSVTLPQRISLIASSIPDFFFSWWKLSPHRSSTAIPSLIRTSQRGLPPLLLSYPYSIILSNFSQKYYYLLVLQNICSLLTQEQNLK